MCVTPAGKIGNCTCGMPKLLPHSGKKSSLLSLFNRSKTVSSHFLFLPIFHPEGSGVLSFRTDIAVQCQFYKFFNASAKRASRGTRVFAADKIDSFLSQETRSQ